MYDRERQEKLARASKKAAFLQGYCLSDELVISAQQNLLRTFQRNKINIGQSWLWSNFVQEKKWLCCYTLAIVQFLEWCITCFCFVYGDTICFYSLEKTSSRL